MISPTMIAPNSEPTNAPTIPPQKWSGRKIVKCQIARPIITQPSIPISVSPPSRDRSSGPSARPAVTTVARAPAALRGGRLALDIQVGHQFLELLARELLARLLRGDQAAAPRAPALLRRLHVVRLPRHGCGVGGHCTEFANDPRAPVAVAALALLPVREHRRGDEDRRVGP